MNRCWLPLLLICTGCVDRLVDFHVHRLEGVRCTGIDGNGFNLVVRCQLENPNALGAEVSQVRFRSLTGSHLLGQGRFPGPVKVNANSRFVLQVPVRVSYADLPADLPRRVASGMLLMRTEVDLRAKTSLGSYSMHLTTEDRVKIAEALKVAIQGPFQGQAFRIDSIRLAGLELRRIRLRIRFVARNMFGFPVRIRGGRYSVSINGALFGDGKLERPIAVPPRRTVTVDAKVLATHGAVTQAIAAMLGADPRFRVKGTLWIDPIGGVSKLPIDIQAGSDIFAR